TAAPAEAEEQAGQSAPNQDAKSAKAINDAAAYIRSLAEMRGRNADWAEKAVREAASLAASAALEQNVIDLMADDVPGLLAAIDGRVITIGGQERTLATDGLIVEEVEKSWRIKLLEIITDPNLALILMMIGVYGLILEFYNPGTMVAGTIGAICLLLALYSLNVLPVNYAGLALIGLGLALMVAEAFAPSFGILGLGGGAAFVLGATMLMDTNAPGFQLAWSTIIGTAVLGGGILILIVYIAVRAHRRPVASGEDDLRGHRAKIQEWSEGKGRVLYHSEYWQASGPADLEPGQEVAVTARKGLKLQVAPLEDEAGEGEPGKIGANT
ncbi:MAG: NfeD family protein, partial [Alphaproteobacteria bacterium]|nr:NfeD family protein [Alphaproteobacteria bacterium]